jgi:hypothetical protein
MLYLYQKESDGKKVIYKQLEEHSLGGKDSIVAKYLKATLNKQSEPLKWCMPVLDLFAKVSSLRGNAVLIDLKQNVKGNVSLYELQDVWGYSSDGWTRILLKLQGILIDDTSGKYNKKELSLPLPLDKRPIFTILHFGGTVKNGEIEGRWTPPPPTPYNSALLWPETTEYFASVMSKVVAEHEGEKKYD